MDIDSVIKAVEARAEELRRTRYNEADWVRLMTALGYYNQGRNHILPQAWVDIYNEDALKMDPEYLTYLRLKEKFK